MLNCIRSDDDIDDLTSLIRRELSRPRWALEGHAKEDLFQNVWCHLLRRWPVIRSAYRPEQGCVDSYLRRVVRNIVIDEIRRLGKRRSILMRPQDLELLADEDEDHQASSELRDAIDMAIESLASKIAPISLEILKRRLMNGESVAEIAHTLDLPPEAVSRRLHEAKAELRVALLEQALAGNEALQYLLNRRTSGGGGEIS